MNVDRTIERNDGYFDRGRSVWVLYVVEELRRVLGDSIHHNTKGELSTQLTQKLSNLFEKFPTGHHA